MPGGALAVEVEVEIEVAVEVEVAVGSVVVADESVVGDVTIKGATVGFVAEVGFVVEDDSGACGEVDSAGRDANADPPSEPQAAAVRHSAITIHRTGARAPTMGMG